MSQAQQPAKRNPLTKPGNWLRLLLSGGLLALLLTTVDLQEMGELVAQSNKWLILLAFLVGMVDRVLMAYKWNVLLRAKDVHIPLVQTLIIYWKTTFLGMFLPATVGGDAVRAYALSKENYPTSIVVSSIIIERALGFLALFIMVVVSILLSIVFFGQDFFDGMMGLLVLFAVLTVVGIAGIYVTMREDLIERVSQFAQKRGGKLTNNKIAKKIGEIVRVYSTYRNQRGTLLVFLLLSLLENLFPLVWTYLMALAFGIDAPLLYFFILVPIVLVLIRLPISLDGFGIKEGAFVYFLGLIGVGASEAFLLGFSVHLLTISIILPGGLLYALQGMAMPNKAPTMTVEASA